MEWTQRWRMMDDDDDDDDDDDNACPLLCLFENVLKQKPTIIWYKSQGIWRVNANYC